MPLYLVNPYICYQYGLPRGYLMDLAWEPVMRYDCVGPHQIETGPINKFYQIDYLINNLNKL